MHVINYGGSTTPEPNKAYIFATGVKLSAEHTTIKDLFRLTMNGTATFNSPFAGYDVNVNFYSDGVQQGGIAGVQRGLQMFGTNQLELGTQDQRSVLTLSSTSIDANQTMFVKRNNIIMRFGLSGDNTYGWLGSQTNTKVVLGTGGQATMTLDGAERVVYIGGLMNVRSELKSLYSLFVKNGVLAEDFSIAPINSWSDFVFEPNYSLMPLHEVNNFILENKHLPDVPSAQEVAEEGYSQHEINKVLLQKIEELTLYTIQQQKEIDELKAQLSSK